MTIFVSRSLTRWRVLVSGFFSRMGFGEHSFLLILSVIVGLVTAFAAVGFHELIVFIRDLLYVSVGPTFLYGKGMWLLIVFPAAGGLAVGLIVQYVIRCPEGHGIVDVMESVIRSSGFQKPIVAIEKILTSGITIGSGGSAGAEGPIVQIGAAIASGVGGLFGLARQQMPLLTACGCAAGISAIFNAPFGGVLFSLEVIYPDFSLRAFTPIVVASVVAQVSTLAIYERLADLRHSHEIYRAIFAMPEQDIMMHSVLNWSQVGNFVLLGLVCGLAGLSLTRLMDKFESFFHNLRLPKPLRPALGGAMLGVSGILYVLLFGAILHVSKPFSFQSYPSPAFFGDGYGVVQQLLIGQFPAYGDSFSVSLLLLLVFLCAMKIVGTCMTLASGGSGGIIAPSLFIGASLGGVVGILLKHSGLFANIQPQLYALVGMGAVLAALVHAPMASILIVFELTQDYKVMLPAMLACVVATATARLIYRDSIYTQGLRRRGLQFGGPAELNLLRRLSVEQVKLEPATLVRATDPLRRILTLASDTGANDFVVVNEGGTYAGMIVSEDLRIAMLEPQTLPLLTCGDMLRTELPLLKNTDDLSAVLEVFSRQDVARLPVAVASAPDRPIGLISRGALLKRYQQELERSV